MKTIGLVAHDGCKARMVEWAKKNKDILSHQTIFATRSTGLLLEQALSVEVNKVESGPLGGDLQLGALIVEGKIDILIFFWDPLASQPHDPDVKALLRSAVVWNIPVACNEVTADIIISSSHMNQSSARQPPDFL